nr:ribonuclease H-like domain-containing protein [Tanacetum cinerariifolium]
MRNNTVNDGVDVHVTSDTDHLEFLDNQVSQSPNDEMRASSVEDGSGLSFRIDISSQYLEGNTATQVDDNSSFEGNVPSIENVFPNQQTHTVDIDRDQPSIRRSSKPSKLPSKLNDFVIVLDVNYAFLYGDLSEKDLGVLKYFLGIEILENSNGICMSQRKYCLKLLHEFGLLVAKPVTTLLPENCVLAVNETENDNDGISAIQIATNPVFHKKTKYFKIDVHVDKEKVQPG